MTDSPDTDAGTTFGSSARSYERLRPEIAAEALDEWGPVETARFGGRRVMTPSDVAALFTTFSFYRAASPERRMRFDRHIAGVLDAEWSGACEIDMPTVTLASRVVRRGR